MPLEGYPHTAFDWPVVPDGLRELLVGLRDRYGAALPPIYITESGCAYDDVLDADGRCDDPDRIAYLDGHLAPSARPSDDGVDVRGYFVWSCWTTGSGPRGSPSGSAWSTSTSRPARRTPKSSYPGTGSASVTTVDPSAGIAARRRSPSRRCGSGAAGSACCSPANLGVWMAFFTPIQILLPQQVESIAPGDKETMLAWVIGLGALAAIVANPLAGAFSDRTCVRIGGRELGRRHVWTVGGAVLGAAALVAARPAAHDHRRRAGLGGRAGLLQRDAGRR